MTKAIHSKSAQVHFDKISVRHFHRSPWLGGKPFYALKDVDLRVETQNIAIVGPSGAGKSTLIELLFGLRKPTRGEVYVCGFALSRSSLKQRQALCQHIQLIPQGSQSSLNPYYRVQESLLEPLLPYRYCAKLQQQKVEEALMAVGLDHSLLQRRSDQLSLGQAQRVAIARALILDPCVLVADEPTSSLDPISRQQILKLLKQIQQNQQMRLILVTHDLAAASYLCDEIMVLDHGTVVEHGPIAEIINYPQHPTTQALLQAHPLIRAKVNETFEPHALPNTINKS